MQKILYAIGIGFALSVSFNSKAQQSFMARKTGTNQTLSVIGTLEASMPGDSIEVGVWDHLFSEEKSGNIPHRQITVPIVNGSFRIPPLAVTKLSYCQILLLSNRYTVQVVLFPFTLTAPGDDINIQFKSPGDDSFNYGMTISGKGSFKWQCAYQLMKQEINTDAAVVKQVRVEFGAHTIDSSNYFRLLDIEYKSFMALAIQQEKLLRVNRAKLSPVVSDVMLANAKGKIWKRIFERFYNDGFRHFLLSSNSRLNTTTKRKFENRFWVFYWQHLMDLKLSSIPPERLSFAPSYVRYTYYRQTSELRMLMNNYLEPYYILRDRFEGVFRDHLLTNYLLNTYEFLENGDSMLNDALTVMTDSSCLAIVKNISDNQQIGSEAFNFSLPDTTGHLVRLSDFKGKVVFIDYWFTGCGACEILYRDEIKPAEEHFKKDTNVVFITISVDKHRNTWLKSIYKGRNTSLNAVNLYTGGQGFNAEVVRNFNISYYPRVLLIDRRGKIASNDNLSLKNPDLLINKINALL